MDGFSFGPDFDLHSLQYRGTFDDSATTGSIGGSPISPIGANHPYAFTRGGVFKGRRSRHSDRTPEATSRTEQPSSDISVPSSLEAVSRTEISTLDGSVNEIPISMDPQTVHPELKNTDGLQIGFRKKALTFDDMLSPEVGGLKKDKKGRISVTKGEHSYYLSARKR